ncbi:MAG: sugar ABC transporter permease [Firmicutes bacterium HGW-Firmicutes-7]|nr:MAG: sugar ABC transporter permease [Firmicutes bacterium HGW-Firmicutes-7]
MKKIMDNFTFRKVSQILLKYGIYVMFVVLCIILSFVSPKFLTETNIINILLQTSIIGVIAIGMTFVIIAQGIDVSVGAILAISSGAGVGAIKLLGAPWWLGILVMILIGLIFGLLNGYATAYLKMPAFLVTLATMSIGRGLTLVLSGGKSWFDLPVQFKQLSASNVGGIPVLIILVIILYIIGHYVLKYTVYGRKIYAVGGNPEAARVSGINVKLIIMSTFVVSGLISSFAGILQTARMNSFWASMGTGFEFSAIAAVVIGGTSLSGGVGTLGGTFVGVLIMGVINNALNLWGVSANWQEVARGAIIFIAVMLDAFRTKYVAKD